MMLGMAISISTSSGQAPESITNPVASLLTEAGEFLTSETGGKILLGGLLCAILFS